MICDYYLVRKGYLEIRELYSARKESPYYFTAGFHIKGYIAYIAGILPNIVGFVGAIGKPVPIGATYIYNVNFFAGFITASTVYYLLCRFFPVAATSKTWMEVGDEITEISVAYHDSDSALDHDSGHKGFTEGGVVEADKKRDLDVWAYMDLDLIMNVWRLVIICLDLDSRLEKAYACLRYDCVVRWPWRLGMLTYLSCSMQIVARFFTNMLIYATDCVQKDMKFPGVWETVTLGGTVPQLYSEACHFQRYRTPSASLPAITYKEVFFPDFSDFEGVCYFWYRSWDGGGFWK